MKLFTSILVASVAALVQAQSACNSVASLVPTCAVPCINSAASIVGCATTDYACQCSSSQSNAIQAAAITCVLSACGNSALAVQTSAAAVCACAATAVVVNPTTSSSASVSSSSSSSAAPASTSSTSSAASTSSTASTSSSQASTTAASTTASTTSSKASSTSQSASAVTSSSGQGGALQPWMSIEASILAIFGGLMYFL